MTAERPLGDIEPGTLVALVLLPDGHAVIAVDTPAIDRAGIDPPAIDRAAATVVASTALVDLDAIATAQREVRPRWVLWSAETAAASIEHGVRLSACWDLAAVHRLLAGGWRAEPGRIWAQTHGLDTRDVPKPAPPDLFSQAADDPAGDAIDETGHLRGDWAAGGWADTVERARRWATLALEVVQLQQAQLDALAAEHPRAAMTARSESTAELLCAELAADGLPIDVARAEELIGQHIGPRTRTEAEAAAERDRRDRDVLRHAPDAPPFDLRSPAQVRSLLRFIGIEVPDTRAWRLEALVDAHPLIGPLLTWRKAERILTTFGYGWLDRFVGPDGRLRGTWSGCDGAAGRMTASAGLHNMPAELRGAVVAEPGHRFVRADLGQIEPRVLAAVSGDQALARAAGADDMYAEVADQLAIDRATAKVAFLGAMYGQTTGHGAAALRRLEAAYPVAMAHLASADRQAQVGIDLRTYGGRRVRMAAPAGLDVDPRTARSRAAAQGRYGRNAIIQGAAAEFFKLWAVTVRARGAAIDARVVLCLHDELLVHVPEDHAEDAVAVVEEGLAEAAARWAPTRAVRFLADTAVLHAWSEAKA